MHVVAENYEQTRGTTSLYSDNNTRDNHMQYITIIIHYDSCKTSIYITVPELFPSILVTCKLVILVTCTLSASCESVDSTYTIHLFLHTVTVRLFEALKLNRYNVTYAKPLNMKHIRYSGIIIKRNALRVSRHVTESIQNIARGVGIN